MFQALVFYSFAGLMLFSSVMVITRKNPVASAIYLIFSLFLAAAFYAKLGADFVAAIQVLVYAGAIMVLFLFVIMLLNLEPKQLQGSRLSALDYGVMVLTAIGFTLMAVFMFRGEPVVAPSSFGVAEIAAFGGNTIAVGLKLFQDYVWPFELASLLILLAIVASVVIAKKDPSTDKGARS